MDPKYAPVYIDRAWVKLEQYDSDGVISDCNIAIQLDAKAPAAYCLATKRTRFAEYILARAELKSL